MDEYDKLIGQIRSTFGLSASEMILNTPLGPIKVADLTFLEGWRYSIHNIGFPGIEPALALGGPRVSLADFTDEKGWILQFFAIFRSPFGQLNFKVDDWSFSVTPFLLNMVGLALPSPIMVYNATYNPFTPLGPMYSVNFAPTYPQVYARQVEITLNLPAGSPVPATTVFTAIVGRIWLQDERRFLRSVKRHILEQMTGKKLEGHP